MGEDLPYLGLVLLEDLIETGRDLRRIILLVLIVARWLLLLIASTSCRSTHVSSRVAGLRIRSMIEAVGDVLIAALDVRYWSWIPLVLVIECRFVGDCEG